jgi:hypothetical protein
MIWPQATLGDGQHTTISAQFEVGDDGVKARREL